MKGDWHGYKIKFFFSLEAWELFSVNDSSGSPAFGFAFGFFRRQYGFFNSFFWMGQIILHLILELIYHFLNFFWFGRWQNLDWVEHLGHKVSVTESVSCLNHRVFVLFLPVILLFHLFISIFRLLWFYHLDILHLGPFSLLQSFFKLYSWFYLFFFCLVRCLTQVFAVLNQECTWIDFLLIFIYFFSLELGLFFCGSLSSFSLTLFGSFLVFSVTFFLVIFLLFQSLSFFLLFLKFPFFDFFRFDLFRPLYILNLLLFVFIIMNFCFVLLVKLSQLLPNAFDLFFQLLGFLKQFLVVSVFHFVMNLLNFLFKIDNVILNWFNFALNIKRFIG